jgi:hypothetical protein
MRALYGLKSSGAAWGAHLAYTLHHLGYQFCLAYPDVWCRAASKEDGFPFPYYEYVLVYVDDLLVLSHQGDKMMKALEEFYRLKDGFALPIRYLGAEVKRWTFPNNSTQPLWALSSLQYIKEALKNMELYLKSLDRKLNIARQPLPTNYFPELDVTPLLDDWNTNFYQSQISILHWMVELRRIDIHVQVALLSVYLAQPREGHMEAVYHI